MAGDEAAPGSLDAGLTALQVGAGLGTAAPARRQQSRLSRLPCGPGMRNHTHT